MGTAAERPIDVSAVLPAYNEADNIGRVTDEAVQVLGSVAGRFEVIIVDDGSIDGTAECVEALTRTHAQVHLVRHPRNRGYGAALRSGFEAARLPWLFFTDSDGQFDLSELQLLVARAAEADIVAGYRIQRRDPWYRRLYALGFGRLAVRLVLGVRVRDLNCAFKLMRRDLVMALDLKSDGALINAELLGKAMRSGARIVEVGVRHLPRQFGSQTGGNPRVIVRAFWELLVLGAEIRASRPRARP